MAYPYIIQGSQVTVVINSKPHVVSKSHPMYQRVVDAIKANEWETVDSIIDPKKVVIDYGNGSISVQGDTMYWKGEEFHNSLATRMIRMLQDGFDVKPMVNFMENLMQNPSKRAVTELYGFLEKNSLPITPDGSFLAYKKIRQDYTDCHTGTMNNSVGQVVEMERNKVDDDQNRTCSTGLHFCSRDYLNHFGGERIVIVKINPRDVVSIPNDYNDSKGRACRYEVVDEIDKEKADEAFAKSVQEAAVREASVLTDAERVEVARLIQEVLNQRKAQALAATETQADSE
jgi:hypothetical protein